MNDRLRDSAAAALGYPYGDDAGADVLRRCGCSVRADKDRRSGRLQGDLEDLARWWLYADLRGGSHTFSGARLKLTHVFFGLPERDHKSLLVIAVDEAVTAFET